MAAKESALSLRKYFKLGDKHVLRWFPGHMARGLKDMERKLKSVDCIVEVHDARIPISGRNPNFKHTVLGLKPHILVLNKMDMIDMSLSDQIIKRLRKEGINNILFTNSRQQKDPGLKQIIPLALDLIKSSERFNRMEEDNYRMMIIGVPNVGKSSLINSLRSANLKKGKAAAVGAKAGVTRSLQTEIKVSEVPQMYLLDTPGILTPNIRNVEGGLKLALCFFEDMLSESSAFGTCFVGLNPTQVVYTEDGFVASFSCSPACLQDHLVGEEIIADYLLYYMNKIKNFDYMGFLDLDKPTDDIGAALANYATRYNITTKRKNIDGSGGYIIVPDLTMAACHFVKAYRSGELGNFILDYEEIY